MFNLVQEIQNKGSKYILRKSACEGDLENGMDLNLGIKNKITSLIYASDCY